jgi:HEPN domain-containing protein
MSGPPEAVLEKVAQWMRHGDQDLALARHALKLGEDCPFDLVADHAQQCAEKCLKAYLVFRLVDFPYTHNLLGLMELIPPGAPWVAEIEAAETLSAYAVSARYPGEDEPVTEEEALEAIEIAAIVRNRMRKVLAASAVAESVETAARRTWPLTDAEWEVARQVSDFQESENGGADRP